jgi:ribosome-binding protein aMBF1 (putative translation factor)
MTTSKSFLEESLKDPEIKNEYDALEPEFIIIQAMIDARKATRMTQKELAEHTGIAQRDISKIEDGEANSTLNTLKRLTSGMDMKLKLEFEPA